MTSVFVYTREAHPGEAVPAHTTLEEKLRRAQQMVDRWSIRRPMLVDSLGGDLHRAYGALPNMSWILGRGGRIVYKASWTDARSLTIAVEQLLWEQEQKAAGRPCVPFTLEWAPGRVRDDDGFMEGLLEAGPSAVDEFISAVASVRGEPAARRMRAWWEANDPR